MENNRAGIELLNKLEEDQMFQEFFRCCGSQEFAHIMTNARPFRDFNHLSDMARRIWYVVSVDQWLLAFSAHPKIGNNTMTTNSVFFYFKRFIYVKVTLKHSKQSSHIQKVGKEMSKVVQIQQVQKY
jgi:hypothetical protein